MALYYIIHDLPNEQSVLLSNTWHLRNFLAADVNVLVLRWLGRIARWQRSPESRSTMPPAASLAWPSFQEPSGSSILLEY